MNTLLWFMYEFVILRGMIGGPVHLWQYLRYWVLRKRIDPLAEPIYKDIGQVQVVVTITLPSGQSRKLGHIQAFTVTDQQWIKDIVEISLDKMGTYVRRYWGQAIEPWLNDPNGFEAGHGNDNINSGSL